MIKEEAHCQSETTSSICIWYPKEDDIKIGPHTPRGEDTFWYLHMTSSVSFVVGRYSGDLADDAAAMRKLAAAAAELAGLIEAKAAAGA